MVQEMMQFDQNGAKYENFIAAWPLYSVGP